MSRGRNTFVADYESAGERLVAVCESCQRTALLSYSKINRFAEAARSAAEIFAFDLLELHRTDARVLLDEVP